MPGKWDTSTKRLVSTQPEDFIRWLIPGARFTGTVEAKSLNLNNREIEADTTIETAEDENARELLSLTYVFASLAFVKEAARHWLKRRFRMFEDALKNSWAYQEILQEGKQEERLVALQEQRQLLESLVQARFPGIIKIAKERGNAIDKSDVLQNLILKIFVSETEEEVRQILSR